MNGSRIIAGIVGLAVCVILVGSLLVPVITDATTTERTFDNSINSLAYFDKVDADDEITFVWDHTKPTVATINGDEIALPDPSSYPYGISLVTSEGMSLRYYKQRTDNYNIQSIGGENIAGYYAGVSVDSGTDLSMTITASAIVNNSNSREFTTTGNTYVVSDAGAFVMKGSNTSAYLLGDSNTIATGLSVVSSIWVVMGWDTDTGAAIEPTTYYPADTYSISNVIVDATDVDNYIGVTKLNKITYTVTKIEDPTVTANITYSYFIVPTTVTGELTNHLNDGEIALLSALPVIVIIGLVLAGVGAIFVRNRD